MCARDCVCERGRERERETCQVTNVASLGGGGWRINRRDLVMFQPAVFMSVMATISSTSLGSRASENGTRTRPAETAASMRSPPGRAACTRRLVESSESSMARTSAPSLSRRYGLRPHCGSKSAKSSTLRPPGRPCLPLPLTLSTVSDAFPPVRSGHSAESRWHRTRVGDKAVAGMPTASDVFLLPCGRV